MVNDNEFRTVSVDDCEIVGRGAHGIVYKIAPDTIVKVYRRNVPLKSIRQEKERSRRALVLGVPTAISFDIVRVGYNYGTVYELLDAEPMEKYVNKSRENLDNFIEVSEKLLEDIHSIDATEDLPDMKADHLKWNENIREWIGDDAANRIKRIIEEVPDSHKLLHGDFHMKNIILTKNGPMIIDMDTLCYGDGIFDLATITNSYLIFPRIDSVAATTVLGISVEDARYIWERTLDLYLKNTNEGDDSGIRNKCQILGIVRVLDYAKRGGIPDPDQRKVVCDKCLGFLETLLD